MTNQVNNQSLIPSTDVIQLTLTLKMTTTQVVETSVAVNNNSPIQDLTRTITLRLLIRFSYAFHPDLFQLCIIAAPSAQVKGVKADSSRTLKIPSSPTLVRKIRPILDLKLANDNLYLSENDNTISEIVRM